MFILVGLGNPGEEYENTRHNTGRMVVGAFCKEKKFKEFEEDKKNNALETEGKIGREKLLVVLPETYMNKSGSSLKKIITSKKKAEKMIVVHDDIDLPLGKYKISFGKGSAGHKGVESVMRAVKTKDFFRVRVGVSSSTSKGKIKKPKGEKLLDFLMGKFKSKELFVFRQVVKKVIPAMETVFQQ